MKNKLIIFFLVCLLGTLSVSAQVKLSTLTQLENRVKAGKDTNYIINFWATWCKPGINELSVFEKFRRANTSKPIKVILIRTDLKTILEQTVKPFVKKYGLMGDVYLLNEAPSLFYTRINAKWFGALPATWIVNAKQKSNDFFNTDFTFDKLKTAVEGK